MRPASDEGGVSTHRKGPWRTSAAAQWLPAPAGRSGFNVKIEVTDARPMAFLHDVVRNDGFRPKQGNSGETKWHTSVRKAGIGETV